MSKFKIAIMEEVIVKYLNIKLSEKELPEVEEDVEVDEGTPAKVILYNDEWHTFEEVITQIIKAIKCDFEKAQAITIEVHTKGKAVVYMGDVTECLKVSSILEEIALNTEIEF